MLFLRASVSCMLLVAATTAGPSRLHELSSDDEQSIRALFEQLMEFSRDSQLQSEEARALLTGEAFNQWKEPSFGPLSGAPDKILGIAPGQAVARVPVTIPTGDILDFYFFFQQESGWKIDSLRMLSQTQPIWLLRNQLRRQKRLDEKLQYTLRNAEVTLMSDSQLKHWFSEHRSELEQIVEAVRASGKEDFSLHQRDSAENPELSDRLTRLGAAKTVRSNQNQILVVLGGVLDNTVGFLYLLEGDLPPIEADGYFWIEHVEGSWYLYRTT